MRTPLADVVTYRPDFEQALLAAVLVGYAVIVAVLRVLMLAFDTMSQDLRLLVATAPLSRVARATVAIVPDLCASWVGSMVFGSVALFACASVAPHFGYPEAVAWACAVVVVVGALAAVLELVTTSLGRDVSAARAMAAVGTLAVVCAAMLWVSSSLQSNPVSGAASTAGASFLSMGTVASVLLAVVITTVAQLVWCLAAASTTRVLFGARARRPRLRARTGSLLASSGVSFVRDVGNRFGMVSLAALVLAGFWIESTIGLTVAGQLTVMAFVLVMTGSAVMAYGDFAAVRWRVHAGPAHPRRAVFAWLAGHLVAAGAIGGAAVAALVIARPSAFSGWQASDWTAFGSVSLIGLGSGLLAGRLLPYEKDDVFSIASTGFVDMLIALSAYWLTGRAAAAMGLPLIVPAGVFAACAMASVVVVERRNRPVRAGPLPVSLGAVR